MRISSLFRNLAPRAVAFSALVAWLAAGVASADPVSISMPVHGTTPTTGFTATLVASGFAAISGNGKVNTVFGGSQSFTLPAQNVPITLNGGSVSVGANSNGTIGLTYDNSSGSLAPISIDSGNIDLLNGSNIPINFNPANVSATTSILGINVDLNLQINAAGSINNLIFNAIASALTTPEGENPGVYALPGTFDIGGNLSATGTGSILGIDFGLGEILNETIDEQGLNPFDDGGLPGLALLTQTPSIDPMFDDLTGQYFLPDLGIPITIPIEQSGTVTQNPGGGSFGSLKSLNLNYTITLSVELQNISYDVTGNATNAVLVPEPSSLLLFSLAGVGLIAFGYRRRR